MVPVKEGAGASAKAKAPLAKSALPQILKSLQIGLDGYGDVFSDFDSSPYQSRLISDDLIKEMRKHHSEDKRGRFVVLFTLPKEKRSQKTEALIRRRLKEHFSLQLEKAGKEADGIRNNGIIRVLSGGFLSISLLVFPQLEGMPFLSMLPALFWFLAFTGFDLIFDVAPRTRRKKRFFESFMNAQYNFSDDESMLDSLSQPAAGS